MAIEQNREEAVHDLEGLDGWLIVVGIGLFATPIKLLLLAHAIYADMLAKGESWSSLSEAAWWVAYSPLEHSLYAILVLVDFYLIFLFFLKKRAFPKVFIWVYLIGALMSIAAAFIPGLMYPEVPLLDPETLKELGKSLVAPLIWVPYMIRSRRVKATFVR